MTREKAKELLPIITAFAEGETIQCFNWEDNWEDMSDPDFSSPPGYYRIKPKPKPKPRPNEVWVRFDDDGNIVETLDRASDKGSSDFVCYRQAVEKPDAKQALRIPLPPGTVIEWDGDEAVVLRDDGGKTIYVDRGGVEQTWEWVCGGTECTVVSLPPTADAPQQP